ncbi:alkaline phosphatase, tissue-nonspecific isozyme [Trichonephila clavipes]|nr:alkaline phosphatase, tissue-nonspecific isozyme [Trichonephila clavipes]
MSSEELSSPLPDTKCFLMFRSPMFGVMTWKESSLLVADHEARSLDDKTSDVDSMPYTTLLYANGPGYNHNFPMGRENLTGMNTEDKNYVQQSAVPRRWDTHGGEDVPVYAHGPMAHLFRGVLEQTYIPHAMAYAACIGPQRDDCERRRHAFHRQVIECPSPHTNRASTLIPFSINLSIICLFCGLILHFRTLYLWESC